MSALYQTNFETETTNVAPAGWTAIGDFRTFTWSERGVAAISGTKGIFSAYSFDTGLWTDITAQGNQAARIAFRVPGLTNAAHRSWSVLLRANAEGSQYYRATFESDDTALRLSIYNYNAGNTLLAASSTYSFAPGPDDLVHLEFFAVGTTLSARAWIEGTSRPAAISGSGTSAANYATATAVNSAYATGYAGIQLAGSPSGTWYGGDNFVVTDGAGGEDYFYPASVDTTAPVLTNATGAAAGATSGTASVQVSEAANVWCLALAASASNPSGPTIKTSGTLQAAGAAGVVTFTNRSGLTTGTAYKNWYYAEDPANNPAAVVSSASYTPTAANAAPTFPGNIVNIAGTGGVAITPVNVSSQFADTDTLTYSASPGGTAWPSGLTINPNTGVISGTVANGTTSGLKVRATDTASQTVDSNAFSVTMTAAATASLPWPTWEGATIPVVPINGGPRAAFGYRVAIYNADTDALVLRLTGQVSHATTGLPQPITGKTELVAGTWYRRDVISDADRTVTGSDVAQAV